MERQSGLAAANDREALPVSEGYVDPPLRSSKVALVGFATETMGFAPFEDPDCEIWILNMLHAHVPRWDRIWEMHDRVTLEVETKELKKNMDHLGVLQAECVRPVYMVDRQPDIPCSVRFPIEDVAKRVGARCEKLQLSPYFTSTFGYMLAWAVLGIIDRRRDAHVPEPGEEIYICGIELLNTEEYSFQRANAEFLVGYALGHGIDVHIPGRSALLESDGMYGYEPSAVLEVLGRQRLYYHDRKQQALAKREQAGQARDKAQTEVAVLEGQRLAYASATADAQRRLHGWVVAPAPVSLSGYRPDHPAAAHASVLDPELGTIDLHGRKRLAICGFAESTRGQVPVDDSRWAILGMNQVYVHLPRCDVFFDVHEDWRASTSIDGSDHEGMLRTCGVPVVLLHHDVAIPTAVRFPLRRVLAIGPDYFTSSASLMVAWAIDHIDRNVAGVNPRLLVEREAYGQYRIGLFGINMGTGDEYAHQRPCLEFWLGIAASRGIQIDIPAGSSLMRHGHRYGSSRFMESAELVRELTDGYRVESEKLSGQISAACARREQAKADWNSHDGAMQTFDWVATHLQYLSRGGKV